MSVIKNLTAAFVWRSHTIRDMDPSVERPDLFDTESVVGTTIVDKNGISVGKVLSMDTVETGTIQLEDKKYGACNVAPGGVYPVTIFRRKDGTHTVVLGLRSNFIGSHMYSTPVTTLPTILRYGGFDHAMVMENEGIVDVRTFVNGKGESYGLKVTYENIFCFYPNGVEDIETNVITLDNMPPRELMLGDYVYFKDEVVGTIMEYREDINAVAVDFFNDRRKFVTGGVLNYPGYFDKAGRINIGIGEVAADPFNTGLQTAGTQVKKELLTQLALAALTGELPYNITGMDKEGNMKRFWLYEATDADETGVELLVKTEDGESGFQVDDYLKGLVTVMCDRQ